MALPLAIAAIPSIAQMGFGIAQNIQGRNLQRNEYIPPSMKQAVENTRRQASSQRMPGQSEAEDNIRSMSGATNYATRGMSSGDRLLALSASDRNTKDALRSLGTQSAQFQLSNMDAYNTMLQRQGMMEFENEMDFRRQREQLQAAGAQNIFGGLDTASAVGIYGVNKGNNPGGINTPNVTGGIQARPGIPSGINMGPMRNRK